MLQRRAVSVAILFGVFAFILFSTHFKLISLPFFWDEAGQFISQAQDLYQGGALIPKSAMPNSHPPGLPLLLAVVWKVFGYSIP
ncbi:MAG: glycosyltransferase, partial [Acidobacteria bacterium]|nr:glycosyltransferase [Acidobacteriota bacterium]